MTATFSRCGLIAFLLMALALSSCASQNNRYIASTQDPTQIIADKVLETPLIPRDVLLAPGEKMRVRLSPDGTTLSSIQPVVRDGKIYYGIFIRSIKGSNQKETQILPEPLERFPAYVWSLKPGWMAYTRDIGGNENDQLFILSTQS